MLIICPFSDILSNIKSCFGIAGMFAITLRFLKSCQHVFRLWFHACNLLYVTSPKKQVTDVSLVLKDSDMDSENLKSLIRLSVSDGQKTDSSEVSYRYIIIAFILTSRSESTRLSRVPVWSELANACKMNLVLGGKVPNRICSEVNDLTYLI